MQVLHGLSINIVHCTRHNISAGLPGLSFSAANINIQIFKKLLLFTVICPRWSDPLEG